MHTGYLNSQDMPAHNAQHHVSCLPMDAAVLFIGKPMAHNGLLCTTQGMPHSFYLDHAANTP